MGLGDFFGGGSKTSSSTTQIPKWLTESSKDLVGYGENLATKPYEAYTGERFVDPTQREREGWHAAGTIGHAAAPHMGQAADLFAGANQRFGDADMGEYMNPYIEGVLQPAAREMGESFERQRNQANMQAPQRGAFGGMRNEIGNDLREESYLEGIGDLYSQGMGDAWNQATDLWQADRAQQQDLGQQYMGLGETAAGLRGMEADAMMQAGQAERAIPQARRDFDYQQFAEGRDYDMTRFQPWLSAVSSVPYNTSQSGMSGSQASGGQIFTQGAGLAATAASFLSSRDYKTDGEPVEGVLERIAKMPVESWRYKGDDQRHIGPYAEDMQEQMGVGNGREIPVIDAVGTQFAGLREAAERIKRLEQERA